MKSIRLAMYLSFALITAVLAQDVQARSWISSGGELFRYGKNPWFLKNVKDVEYCVEIDAGAMSASKATIQSAIVDGIAYWKNEFKAQTATSTNGFAAIGTQTFTEIASCKADTVLRFKFGAGTLDKDEREQLADEPSRFVGVSIRKEYDNEKMSGSGIIFISGDLGSEAYNARPNSTHLIAKAWQEKKLLTYALVHELGHVFGIPHTGAGLMSEVFLEQLLNKRFVKFYLDNPIEPFLMPALVAESCMLSGSFNAGFFQAPADTACLRIEGTTTGSDYEWSVYSRKSVKDVPVLVGTLKGSPLLQLAISAKPAVIVQLPSEQKVFSLTERAMNTFMIGPLFTETTIRAVYTTITSKRPYDVQVELRPESIVMTGVLNNRMQPVFVYSPPSLLSKIFPVTP